MKIPDVIANLVLYLPLGLAIDRSAPITAVDYVVRLAGAAALSGALEATQLFSHSRFPSMTDLVCNVIGTAVGLGRPSLARTAHKRRQNVP